YPLYAGAVLVVPMFLRFDAVVAVAATVAGIMLGYVAGQRLRWTFFAPLGLGTALCVLDWVGPSREYFALPRIFITHLAWWQLATLAAAALVLLGVFVA